MRLVNTEYAIDVEFSEEKAAFLVLEEKQMRLKLIEELCQQCKGEMEYFVLSEKDKILKMQKTVDILLDPFVFDCNNRKVLTKLYQDIRDYGNEELYQEKEKINREILVLLDKIMFNVPYHITTSLEFDWVELCKLYNVQIETSGDTLLEKLMDYIRVMSCLCGYKVFVLLNFTMYLKEEELEKLCEFGVYLKVYLLFIEYTISDAILGKNTCIVDKDYCMIKL